MVEILKYPGKKVREFATKNTTHCSYALFDRHGGVSKGLYASLNVGHHVGDEEAAVQENRRKVKMIMEVPHVLSAKQVHGIEIHCLTKPLTKDTEVDGYDALITDLAGVGLMIQQADCQAVLLFDPVREVIAAVHCGWRGSVQQILSRVISVMIEKYQTNPVDLQAVISPSLGPCCAEFVNYRQELPSDFQQFMVRDNYFDFRQITRYQLMGGGVSEEKIKMAGICTCCSADYFSYRRAKRLSDGLTGRNCSFIALDKISALNQA